MHFIDVTEMGDDRPKYLNTETNVVLSCTCLIPECTLVETDKDQYTVIDPKCPIHGIGK
jgi:hypothetical protein